MGPPNIRIKKAPLSTEEYNKRFIELTDYIAAVVGQTHVERGEASLIADDRALLLIRELLLDFDETIMNRNAHRGRLGRVELLGFRPWRTDLKIVREPSETTLDYDEELEVHNE